MCQTLLSCWGGSDEQRGALAPLSSVMSIGWRGVRENHEQNVSGSAQAVKKTEDETRSVGTWGEQGAG